MNVRTRAVRRAAGVVGATLAAAGLVTAGCTTPPADGTTCAWTVRTVARDLPTLEKAVHDYAGAKGLGMGQVVNALRVATTGQGVGPGLYDCLYILGREACRARIASTRSMLRGE